MNKNLLWKLLFILGTMLFFLFGIFGIPKGLSGEALATALTDHIHLGLDLKGGTHLILQVHVNDAINVDAQNAIEVLKQQLKSRKIDYADISQTDPAEQSRSYRDQGCPAGRPLRFARASCRNVCRSTRSRARPRTAGIWSMKPSMLSDLKNKAVYAGDRDHPQPY